MAADTWRLRVVLVDEATANALRERLLQPGRLGVLGNSLGKPANTTVFAYTDSGADIGRVSRAIAAGLNELGVAAIWTSVDEWLADEARWSTERLFLACRMSPA